MTYDLLFIPVETPNSDAAVPQECEAGWWTVIDEEICDGPFPTQEGAHEFMRTR
jgi:hypothetical protein